MGKFEKEAKQLLEAIGGKENVNAVTHCATRMRFVLADEKKANVKVIEDIPAVKGTFTNAGQFQVIIGNDIPIFYNDFTAVSGIEGVSKEAAKSAAKSNQNAIQRVMTMLAEIFTPIIPALIVGGLILGFRNVLEGVQMEWLGQAMKDGQLVFDADGNPVWNTIVQVSPFWNGVNHFLWLPGEAIFHFLPVGITWSVSRKMGTSQILGIVLGICLVSPQLLNAYAVPGTDAATIASDWSWNFGAIFGALYAPFVITGLHHMTNAIDTQLIADAGGTGLWPMIALSNIAQGSAVFAYFLMNRHNEKEAQVSLPATISAYLGVTEPALFGVNVKYVYPFVAAMIGSSIVGLLSVTFNIQAASIGIGGLPGILSIKAEYWGAFFMTMIVAIVVPMILTAVFKRTGAFSKKEETVEEVVAPTEAVVETGAAIELISPLTGQTKELSQATDPVFASGVMGQGVLIDPTEGLLVAPVDGEISVLFPTNHAVGITATNGVEFLMHIGMDTVGLEGKGFTAHVKQGDKVKAGDKLISFDIDVIKAAGLVAETPVIVTNQTDFDTQVIGNLPRAISQGEAILTVTKN
ncbi:PTS sugar transporter subunit IIBCA [Streptococcus suis]|uniref:PTS sugar transporter subunit IIBCA n=1 Tax=Streptococcus suis TaxID=1307 RepID=UPI001F05E54C|nr:glucose PTS transporter subunit IIA [Streptococcus suis]MCH1719999.1 glucose PTS transporter subunit IIA [Streptococcus suis]MCL4911420.1 glucose PTS transporter subunit IIA [Streptococcus suis]HEM4646457.1 PTS glucose transporter subunit IIA [Streptococcus suis]HEM6462615.1 PTS glucose transporter subunit IIA [Streptococcus suis]